MPTISRNVVLTVVATVIGIVTPALAQNAAQKKAFAESVQAQIDAMYAELDKTGDFKKAGEQVGAVMDTVIAYAGNDQDELFEDAVFARRLLRQVAAADKNKAKERLAYLRDPGNDTLARTLVFLADESGDHIPGVYNTLDKLREAQKGRDRLDEFATLTAAICVVHDVPLTRRINENEVKGESAEEIWDYYATNEKRMFFGLKNVPAELLVFVVDNPASVQEMQWALSDYAGNRAIGKQFFNIAYDYDHFLHAKPKKVSQLGFNLPNIKKYGGVCADQAYFAVTVGKSIGVPAVYTYGAGGQVSHAWVGYLQQQGRTASWNFDEGRYEEYQGVRGNTEDPQRKKIISDSEVAVLAEMIGTPLPSVRRAAAMLDAAERLDQMSKNKSYPPAPPEGMESLKPRPATIASQLDLIEQSLRQCAGYKQSWQRVATLAQQGRLSLDDKKQWATVLDRLCAGKYPDFTIDILAPMIATIEDVDDREAFWSRLAKTCGKRKDLAAFCRIEQGKMWEAANEKGKAFDCYQGVIDTYINDGPFALEALGRAEKMLVEAKRDDVLLTMYDTAFSRTSKPDFAAVFATQSNWFKVGKRYAYWLERAGDRRATGINNQLNQITNGN